MPGKPLVRALTQSFARNSTVFYKKADETQLWIELLIEDCKIKDENLPLMHRKAGEIIAIFTTIVSKVRRSL